MNIELIASITLGSLLLVFVGGLIYRRIPKRLKAVQFVAKWRELQANLNDARSWPNAVIEADKLLDKALKKRKFRGKSMGERLVSAQKIFTDNDSVWSAHNLCKKIMADSTTSFREKDVKAALIAFRQALRDIGALPSEKEQSSGKLQEEKS